MTYLIRKGDPTTTGGTVKEGEANMDLYGKPTTLEGMIATCPACKKGEGPIKVIGQNRVDYLGRLVVVEGDHVLCGCPAGANTVIATQKDAKVD